MLYTLNMYNFYLSIYLYKTGNRILKESGQKVLKSNVNTVNAKWRKLYHIEFNKTDFEEGKRHIFDLEKLVGCA